MGRVDIESIKECKIDERDKKILYLLSKDSRIHYNEIARKVLISADSVKYRIDRMIEKGIIIKFIPDISFRQFGFYKFSAFIQIIEVDEEQERQFVDYLKKNRNIISVMKYTDKFDFEIVLITKTILDYDNIINKIQTDYCDIIDSVCTFQQVKSYKSVFIPEKYARIKKDNKIPKKKLPEKVKIDKLDLQLISELNKNARESSYIIAERLKTSVDTILYRIKKLEEHDIIHRFTTIINFSMLGYNWYSFLLSIKSMNKQKDQKLKEFIRRHNNIIRGIRGIGEFDVILYMVAFNQPGFHKAVNELRTEFRDIIKYYDTLLGYKECKFEEYEKCLFDVLD